MKQVIQLIISGASGFIGSELATFFYETYDITKLSREQLNSISCLKNNRNDAISICRTESLNSIIIHLAGPAHTTKYKNDPQYYDENIVTTSVNLYEYATKIGAKKFIYASSVKAFGECNVDAEPFTENSKASPSSYYGKSKLAAEQKLSERAALGGPELYILRLPPVYDENTKGAVKWFFKLSKIGIPLPIGNLPAHRSFLSIYNLKIFAKAIIEDKVQPGLYCPCDLEISTVGRFYQSVWKVHSPAPWLISFVPWLPKIFYRLMRQFKIMPNLFESFAVSSIHRELYHGLGFLDSENSISQMSRETELKKPV